MPYTVSALRKVSQKVLQMVHNNRNWPLRRDVPFEPGTILDTMLEEVERLQQFFPYVEQVYLDLVRGEGERKQNNG